MNDKKAGTVLKRIPAYGDFLLSFSGICLSVFLFMHLVFDAMILVSPDSFNGVTKLLHSIYLAQVFTPLVVVGFFVHVVLALRKIPLRSGEIKSFSRVVRFTTHRDTILWGFQCFTGIMLLFAGTFHFSIIFSDGIGNINAVSSSQRASISFFHVFYNIFMCAAVSHAGIGMYRVGNKWFGTGRKIIFAVMILISCAYAVMSFMAIGKFHERGKIQNRLKYEITVIEGIVKHGGERNKLTAELENFRSLMKQLELEISPEMLERLGIECDDEVYKLLSESLERD